MQLLSIMRTALENSLCAQKQERDQLLSKQAFPRDLEADLKSALPSRLVKVITGPRRCGKSTLAFQILRNEQFGYVNFEDNTLPKNIDTNELVELLDKIYGSPKIFFFDEIQMLPKWEQFLNTLQRRGRNLIVTGSNSRLLSGELGSALTGRHLSLELLPLSFKEFCSSQRYIRIHATLEPPTSELVDAAVFDKYFHLGGFPEVAFAGEEPSRYLSALTDSIILRDIVQRKKLRNPHAIAGLLGTLLQEASTRFSASNLSQSTPGVSLSVTTILKYLAAAQEAYLLFELQPFFAKTRVRMKADRKLYVVDHALARSRNIGISEKRGALLENLIFIELVRRGFSPNRKLFYYQTKSGKEIDFLLMHTNGDVELLQVSYETHAMKTRVRELSAFVEAARATDAKKLTIITYGEQESIMYEGLEISVVPAYRWLREPH